MSETENPMVRDELWRGRPDAFGRVEGYRYCDRCGGVIRLTTAYADMGKELWCMECMREDET